MTTSGPGSLAAARPVCWCGEKDVQPFSPEYVVCHTCGTLVSWAKSTVTDAAVHDDDSDFYGKDYWLGHQVSHLGLPSIRERARHDLPERCLYWLRNLLAYKPPPGRVMDIGCAHGGFVALMQHLGYDAHGAEVSPWVVQFARETFDIPVLHGPIEEQDLPPQSFDALVLNDVVEHLHDPVGTLSHCARLLKPDGVLIVQMPAYPDGATHEELVGRKDPFLHLMEGMAREHLHLFSRRAAERLLQEVGLHALEFLPPLFSHDMYLIASRAVLRQQPLDVEKLLRTPAARLVQGLLDLDTRCRSLESKLSISEADRAARLEVITRLNTAYRASEADRAARMEVITRLQGMLQQSAADRTAVAIERLRLALQQAQQDLAAQQAATERVRAAYRDLAVAQQQLLERLGRSSGRWWAMSQALRRPVQLCKKVVRRLLGRGGRAEEANPNAAAPPARDRAA